MKRRDDRDHMSREAFEAQDEDDEDAGPAIGFSRASADELAKRKIIKTKR